VAGGNRDGLGVSGRRGHRQERSRAGRQARQLVRNEWRDERRRFRKLLIQGVGGLLLAVACITAASAWFGVDRFFLGLFIGLGLASVPLLVVQLKISTGIAARERGAEAERWTAEELDKLDPRQWKMFHDVPVRWGNVDHVAVGPGRVYAIETKWTTAKGRFRETAAQQAAKQAARLAEELSSRGVDRQVVPLLVIWGNGVAEALEHKPELDKQSQTRIVAGATATDWLERMSKAADRFTVDWPATRAVRSLVEDAEKGSAAPR
jgi:hypothetical protein